MSDLNFDPIVLTQYLVKCQSVTPEDAGALDIVEKHLSHLEFACTRLPFSGNNSYAVDNLFATIGSNGKHLAFAGHTDVVPAGNFDSWTYPPFKAIIKASLNPFSTMLFLKLSAFFLLEVFPTKYL